MLHQELQRGDYVAIAGMGGVGKTELATQYARRYQQDYGGIAWFNDRESNLAAEVLEFFIKFGFEIPQELGGTLLSLKEQVAWCWSKYPDSALPILIVFDDVTDLANLREVVPNDNRFRVLITTRLRRLDPNFIQEIPLDVLSPEKALELLKGLLRKKDKRIENEPKAATDICECLEYLPLGIELVAGYLVRDLDLSLHTMFGQLQERKLAEAALQNRETLHSTQLGVKAAFALTWEELDPVTQQLGKLLSLFSPQSILWELVVWVATENDPSPNLSPTGGEALINDPSPNLSPTGGEALIPPSLAGKGGRGVRSAPKSFPEMSIEETQAAKQAQPADIISVELPTIKAPHPQPLPASGEGSKSAALAGWGSDELNEAKKQLYQRNLLQQIDETGCYKIHALVRWFLQGQLAESGEIQRVLETTFATAMIAKAQSLPQSPTSEDIEGIKDVVPHIEDLGNRLIAEVNEAREGQAISSASVPNDEVISVFVGVGRFYKEQGLYKLAEPWYEDCLNVCQALFDGDHPDVATSLNNLAGLYYSLGRYSDAEPMYVQALVMRKRLFIGDHPNLAQGLNNLAGLYHSLGRYSDAEPMYVQALAMTKRLFVGDHPHVALSLNNLALLYYNQGRYSDAEPLYIDALEMTKRLFLSDHPHVASSLNNLALLYNSLGRYSEAKPLYIDALAMRKRLFLSDHPNVATSLNNLAGLYDSLGRYSDAEPLYIDALAMKKRLFLGDHTYVASSLNNLAALYKSLGQYSEAEPLYIDALAMRKRLFLGDHPDVALSLNNLAALYDSLGRYSDAEPLYIEALAICDRLLGVNHRHTATVRENLTSLQRQLTPRATPKRGLGQFVQALSNLFNRRS